MHGNSIILTSPMEATMNRLSGLMALAAFLAFSMMSPLSFAAEEKKEEKKGGNVVVFGEEKKEEKKGGKVVVFGDDKKEEKKDGGK
jgi:lipopolysaccharide export LptBFGC system permease protein LptF